MTVKIPSLTLTLTSFTYKIHRQLVVCSLPRQYQPLHPEEAESSSETCRISLEANPPSSRSDHFFTSPETMSRPLCTRMLIWSDVRGFQTWPSEILVIVLVDLCSRISSASVGLGERETNVPRSVGIITAAPRRAKICSGLWANSFKNHSVRNFLPDEIGVNHLGGPFRMTMYHQSRHRKHQVLP